jgi:AcrR family transcriptional regulator
MARPIDSVKHRAGRQEIMHAAAGLFAVCGYEGTATARICEAAQIGAATASTPADGCRPFASPIHDLLSP